MWIMRRKNIEELDSIVYFLSHALTGVIEDCGYLAHHNAMLPQIGAGLATAEIASRLAMFREQVCDVSEREAMALTKLARARHWAHELRRHEPHLRADLDAFLSATACCEAMAQHRGCDAHSLFDGRAQPKRFLSDRMPGGRAATEAALSLVERLEPPADNARDADETPHYLIGGQIRVEALSEACDRLLARLSVHYGWEDQDMARDGEAPDTIPPDADARTTPAEDIGDMKPAAPVDDAPGSTH